MTAGDPGRRHLEVVPGGPPVVRLDGCPCYAVVRRTDGRLDWNYCAEHAENHRMPRDPRARVAEARAALHRAELEAE